MMELAKEYIINPGKYREVLESTLVPYKQLYKLLQNRLDLIDSRAPKNEFEQNEVEITRIKTLAELNTRKKVIEERERYNQKFMHDFIVDMDNMRKDYDKTLSTVKQMASKGDKEASELLRAVKWPAIEKNIEAKRQLYKMLKKIAK